MHTTSHTTSYTTSYAMFIRLDLERGHGSGVHIACTIAQAQEFATLHGNIFIQASTAPSAAAGAGGPWTPSPLLLSVAAGSIESSHGRPDPRRQFLGLATDPTRQDSIPLVVAGS